VKDAPASAKAASGGKSAKVNKATEQRIVNVAKSFGVKADDAATAASGLAGMLGADKNGGDTSALTLASADVFGVKHGGDVNEAAAGLAKMMGVDLDAKALAAALKVEEPPVAKVII